MPAKGHRSASAAEGHREYLHISPRLQHVLPHLILLGFVAAQEVPDCGLLIQELLLVLGCGHPHLVPQLAVL